MESSQKKSPDLNAPVNAATPVPEMQHARPAELPLGDVARYYRELYRIQAEQQKARDRILPGEPALAMPKLTAPEIILRRDRRAPQSRGLRDPFSRTGHNAPVTSPASNNARLPHQTPVPQARPLPAAKSVVVRRGDSLWKLAAQYLGDGARWHAILAANPQLSDPNLIQVGQQLALPHAAPAESAGAYKIARGDSMWKLAQNHLGSGFAWNCVAQVNPHITNANRIYPGQKLNIPAACSESAAAVRASKVPPTTRASN